MIAAALLAVILPAQAFAGSAVRSRQDYLRGVRVESAGASLYALELSFTVKDDRGREHAVADQFLLRCAGEDLCESVRVVALAPVSDAPDYERFEASPASLSVRVRCRGEACEAAASPAVAADGKAPASIKSRLDPAWRGLSGQIRELYELFPLEAGAWWEYECESSSPGASSLSGTVRLEAVRVERSSTSVSASFSLSLSPATPPPAGFPGGASEYAERLGRPLPRRATLTRDGLYLATAFEDFAPLVELEDAGDGSRRAADNDAQKPARASPRTLRGGFGGFERLLYSRPLERYVRDPGAERGALFVKRRDPAGGDMRTFDFVRGAGLLEARAYNSARRPFDEWACALSDRGRRSRPRAGLGLRLASRNGRIVVSEVVSGSPAARDGGLKLGDRIAAVAQGDGAFESVDGWEVERAGRLIGGDPGTEVRLRVFAGGSSERTISLVRAAVDGRR